MNYRKSTPILLLAAIFALGSFFLSLAVTKADDSFFGPNLVSYTSDTPDGTYGSGSLITVTANFDVTLNPFSNPVLNIGLNDGTTLDLANVSGNKLSGSYFVQPGGHASDLSVGIVNFANNIQDQFFNSGFTYYNIPPGQNLGDNSNIVIDAHAMFSSAAVSGSTLTLTYDSLLNAASVPDTSDFVVHDITTGSTLNVNSVDVPGDATVILTLANGPSNGDTVTIDYTPGVNPLQDTNGSDMDPLVAQSVTNIDAAILVGASPIYSSVIGTNLYVVHTGGNSISVVDTDPTSATYNTSVMEIPVGSNPDYSTVVGTKLYVSNRFDNSVSVIDGDPTSGAYNTVIATIPVGVSPIYSSVVGTRLYVSNTGSTTISVIDANPTSGAYNTVIATLNVTPSNPVGTNPSYSKAVGNRLYIGNYGYAVIGGAPFNNILVIDADPASGTYNNVIATIDVGVDPYYFSLIGTKLYINNQFNTIVPVIETDPTSGAYNTVIATPHVGIAPGYSSVAGKNLYVLNNNSNSVSVIDADPASGAYNTVISTIAVGSQPINSSVIGKKVYVVNNNSTTVSVLDADPASGTYNTVIATIPVGVEPGFSAVASNKIYVHNSTPNTLSVIDPSTNSIFNILSPHLTTITSTSLNGLYTSGQTVNITANFNKVISALSKMRLTLNSGATIDLSAVSGSTLTGSYLIGAGDSTPDLSVSAISNNSSFTSVSNVSAPLNTQSTFSVPPSPELTGDSYGNLGDLKNIVIGDSACNISVGTNPYQLTAVGSLVYVADQGSNDVRVIDTDANNTVVATISVGTQPYGLAYNTTTKEIYVANLISNNVSVIDADPASGTYNTVTHVITVGKNPFYVASLGSDIYVTNHSSNSVSIINTGTHAVTKTVAVGEAPLGIKAHGTDIYVANFGSSYGQPAPGSVSVIDSVSKNVTHTITVGSGARGVAVNGNEIYVANYNDGTVSVIDSGSNVVTHTIAVGNNPRGMLSFGSHVYAENYADGTISVIDTGSHSVTGTYKVGNTPAGMINVGTNIYLSRFTDNIVSIFDTTNNVLLSSCVSASASTSTTTEETVPVEVKRPGGSRSSYSQVVIPISEDISNPLSITGTSTNITEGFTSSEKEIYVKTSFGGYQFPRTLNIGYPTGNDVIFLQRLLNLLGFTVSKTGAGSFGNETNTFASRTKAALVLFQKAYGIEPTSGFFGPITRAYLNNLLKK